MKHAPVVEFIILLAAYTGFRVLGWISGTAYVSGVVLFMLWGAVGVPLTLIMGDERRVRAAYYIRGVYHVVGLVVLIAILQYLFVELITMWSLYFTIIRNMIMWMLLVSLSVEFLHNVYLSVT